jgi:uncharacterized repeat protein (TIGR01451 family)
VSEILSIEIQNNSTWSATNVLVTDNLPAGTLFHSAFGDAWDCDYLTSEQDILCHYSSLAGSNTAPPITIRVIAPESTGDIHNIASVTADETSDSTLVIETTTIIETLSTEPADLRIEKSDLPDPVKTGAQLTYTLTIENLGKSPANNLLVRVTLPDGATLLNVSGSGWVCNQSGGTLTCSRSELSALEVTTITVTVLAPLSPGNISNYAAVASESFDDDLSNNTDSETTTITSVGSDEADLVISKTDSDDPAASSAILAYTLSVTNYGPDPAETLMLTDHLPADASLINIQPDDWTCALVDSLLSCTLDQLASNSTSAIILTMRSPENPGTITNTAVVSSGTTDTDTDTTNNGKNVSSTVDITGDTADLSIAGQITSGAPTPDEPITLSRTVTNHGPHSAENILVINTLPDGAAYISTSQDEWTCEEENGMVYCIMTSLAGGDTSVLELNFSLEGTPNELSNLAEVCSEVTDSVPENNQHLLEINVDEPIKKFFLPMILR